MVASEHGFTNVVNELLKSGAYINAVSDNNTPALIWAVMEGKDAMVQFLLEKNADATIESGGVRGETGTALDIARKLEGEKGRDERAPYTRIVTLLEEAAKKN